MCIDKISPISELVHSNELRCQIRRKFSGDKHVHICGPYMSVLNLLSSIKNSVDYNHLASRNTFQL